MAASAAPTRPGTSAVRETDILDAIDAPWVTIVWDDPVNLMNYVTHVFSTYFNYSHDRAERLMMQVHMEGKAIVSSGGRESMECDVQAMHSYGLWATLDRAD